VHRFFILKLNDAGTVFAPAATQASVRSVEYAGTKERLRGPTADRDGNAYNVVWLSEPRGEVPRASTWSTTAGTSSTWRIRHQRQDRTPAQRQKVKSKFSAPKPGLMAFIIEGIMTSAFPGVWC